MAKLINRAIIECICCFIFLYFAALRHSAHHARIAGTGVDEQSPSTRDHRVVSSDGYVRNCVTGDVIGQQPKTVSTEPLNVTRSDSLEDGKSRVDSFQDVFDKRAWGSNNNPGYKGIQASGPGSTLSYAQEITAILHRLVSEVRAVLGLSRVRLLDLPCGDMAWMSRFLHTRDDIDYTGIDIVPSLIDHHRKEYGQFGWKFIQRDVVQDGINDTYDIIVSRMMLQHLYHSDVMRVLAAFSNSGSGYLLTTTFSGSYLNKDLPSTKAYRFRLLNLETEPFSLSTPLCLHRDGPDRLSNNHFVALWRLPLTRIRQCAATTKEQFHVINRTIYSCAPWA